jgi:hypothetical protein
MSPPCRFDLTLLALLLGITNCKIYVEKEEDEIITIKI